MIDESTQERLLVSTVGSPNPYIMIPVSQLETVRKLLDRHKVPYWVDEIAVSLDGRPEVTVVNLGSQVDADEVQRILDCAA